MRLTISLTFSRTTLIAIGICAVLVVGTLFLVGYKSYTQLRETQLAQQVLIEAQIKEREEEKRNAAELIVAQAEQLKAAQDELNMTKTSAEENSDQIKKLRQTLAAQESLPKDIVISSTDLAPYVTSIVQILCISGQNISSGSGILWSFPELAHAVVTNYHVVKGADKCLIIMTNPANNITGIFGLEGSIYTYNQNTDTAILAIGTSISETSVPIANYNYAIGKVRKCPSTIPVGSPTVVIGYPAYAKRDATLTIDNVGTVNVIYRTVTNGIISGYDTSQVKPQGVLNNPNFFISAKIDNGNSGGIALAKDAAGLCALGLPTWLTVGNYENQGLVQNISNIIP